MAGMTEKARPPSRLIWVEGVAEHWVVPAAGFFGHPFTAGRLWRFLVGPASTRDRFRPWRCTRGEAYIAGMSILDVASVDNGQTILDTVFT
jgi:hypothetical protein